MLLSWGFSQALQLRAYASAESLVIGMSALAQYEIDGGGGIIATY